MQPHTDNHPDREAAILSRQGSYFRYLALPHNRATSYPVGPRPDPALYHPAASWIGRLILPAVGERERVLGAWMEVQYAAPPFEHLIGRTVRLRWRNETATNQRFWSVTVPVSFDREAEQLVEKGFVLPERVNHWPLVNPLESLAGAYPVDEMIVRLPEPLTLDETPDDGGPPILWLPREPIQTTGRFYALARFLGPEDDRQERWRIAHFRRETGTFDGPEETVLLPMTVRDENRVPPAVNNALEKSPANEDGWYLYGALNAEGTFVVQSLMPRGLMRLHPQATVSGSARKRRFFHPREWSRRAPRGAFTSTLLCPDGIRPEEESARWREGDAALVVHLYGLYLRDDWTWQRLSPLWGHCAFGTAHVVREPLSGELRFDIEYRQVYVHGESGIISGTHHWTRYTGDRQFGFLGTHPIQDTLIRLDCFTEAYRLPTGTLSPLAELETELEKMAARYRIADGRGGDRISASNNCAQDSSQALYAALKHIGFALHEHPDGRAWLANAPEESRNRAAQLLRLKDDLKRKLLPLGAARADWEWEEATIGSSLSEDPVSSLTLAARTWHTVLPSVAVRYLVTTFLEHGGSAWVLRTNLVGGHDPTITPFYPNV